MLVVSNRKTVPKINRCGRVCTSIMSSLSYSSKTYLPQALASGIYSRINKDPDNALVVNTVPQGRSAKRNAQQINYAEFDNFNDDFDQDEHQTATATTNAVANNQMSSSSLKILLRTARPTGHIPELDDDLRLLELTHKREDVLIPIKLNMEYNSGSSRLVDFFMWNVNESLITPQRFAAILCNDLELPGSLQSEIADSILRQIEEYNFLTTIQLPEHQEYFVIVDLAVSVGKKLYEDRFEWDLQQTDVAPEVFAESVVADLGLELEFKPAIAHSLYEAIYRLKREILEGTYNHELQKFQQTGGLLFECGIRITTEVSIHNGNDQWHPMVEILSPWEIEKREIERERNIRRLKRENMRREVDSHYGAKRRTLNGRRRVDELSNAWNV